MTDTATACRRAAAILLLLLAPTRPRAEVANHAVALEVAGARGGRAAVALEASAWLDGDLHALARLARWSAPRPEVRGSAAVLAPEVGLRWAPDLGRWGPEVALLAGLRLPATGQGGAATGALRAGLARGLGGGWAVGAALGLRLQERERAALEAALGVRRAF